MFFTLCNNWTTVFFVQGYYYFEGFFAIDMLLCSLKQVFKNKSVRYHHDDDIEDNNR